MKIREDISAGIPKISKRVVEYKRLSILRIIDVVAVRDDPLQLEPQLNPSRESRIVINHLSAKQMIANQINRFH
jgi:hypothetical protein